MSIAATVRNKLLTEREAGKTFQAIADKYKLDQSYVVNLNNGKRTFEGITLGTFDRMFPNATVDLDGRTHIVAARVASPGNGNITYGDQSEALRTKILLAVLDLELEPITQNKVIKAIRNTEV